LGQGSIVTQSLIEIRQIELQVIPVSHFIHQGCDSLDIDLLVRKNVDSQPGVVEAA
jgi:hypothetical protein